MKRLKCTLWSGCDIGDPFAYTNSVRGKAVRKCERCGYWEWASLVFWRGKYLTGHPSEIDSATIREKEMTSE